VLLSYAPAGSTRKQMRALIAALRCRPDDFKPMLDVTL
jgi:hypothetical protein